MFAVDFHAPLIGIHVRRSIWKRIEKLTETYCFNSSTQVKARKFRFWDEPKFHFEHNKWIDNFAKAEKSYERIIWTEMARLLQEFEWERGYLQYYLPVLPSFLPVSFYWILMLLTAITSNQYLLSTCLFFSVLNERNSDPKCEAL